MEIESASSDPSSPEEVSEDRGSSITSSLREEYEDLLRYAVVTPNFNGSVKPVSKDTKTTPSSSQRLGVHSTQVTHLDISVSSSEEEEGGESELPKPHLSSPTPDPISPLGPPNMSTDHHVTQKKVVIQPVSSRKPFHTDLTHFTTSQTGDDSQKYDPELARLDNQLDVWCTDLKRNVLAEFEQAKLRSNEQYKNEMTKERQHHIEELHHNRQELERSRELLTTYELSIARKDQIITSLTKSLQKQKERVELARTFSVWRTCYIDSKRESFTSKLALKHHNTKLTSRVMTSWFGLIQGRWKQRVERACQTRAEEVCHQVTTEYEGRLAAVHHSYEEAQKEIALLKQAQSLYEENMKKAFMRGVCALNMEAMSMFQGSHTSHPMPVNHMVQPTNKEIPESVHFPSHTKHQSHDRHMTFKLDSTNSKGGGKKHSKGPAITVERHVPVKS